MVFFGRLNPWVFFGPPIFRGIFFLAFFFGCLNPLVFLLGHSSYACLIPTENIEVCPYFFPALNFWFGVLAN